MIAVRPAGPGDGAMLHAMVRELAAHHGEIDHFHSRPEDFEAALFSEGSFVSALIATVDDAPAGCAILHRSFSTFRGREVMYMEDLSVLPQFRRRGVAKALLREVARLALSRGYPAIAWMMMKWNSDGRALYDGIGAEFEEGMNYCRLHGDALERLAR
jgi:GNAT superfamily N-acetyltransferase